MREWDTRHCPGTGKYTFFTLILARRTIPCLSDFAYPVSRFLPQTSTYLVLSPRVLLYAVLFYSVLSSSVLFCTVLSCSNLSSLYVYVCSIPCYSYLFFSDLCLALQEFWSLGLGQPYPISGIHGTGIGDLLGKLLSYYYLFIYLFLILFEGTNGFYFLRVDVVFIVRMLLCLYKMLFCAVLPWLHCHSSVIITVAHLLQ